jgi:hypothetical protein
MGKKLSLRDFLPVYSGEVREAMPDYGGELEEGAPRELYTYRGLAKTLEGGSVRLLDAVKVEAPAGGPANLDELIHGLLQLEQNAHALFGPLLRQAETANAAWAEPLVRALEALRDSRWQLMALRADAEPADDSPTFSDADQLRRFLNGLS